jgi:hyperosmotically inducible protein
MHYKKRFLVTGVSFMLIIGLAACNKEHSVEKMGKSTDQKTDMVSNNMEGLTNSPGEQINMFTHAIENRAITAKVKTAILGDTDLRVLRIHVDTNDGVTTLSGSVDTQQNSDKASEIAGTVTGVKVVENKLVVKAID